MVYLAHKGLGAWARVCRFAVRQVEPADWRVSKGNTPAYEGARDVEYTPDLVEYPLQTQEPWYADISLPHRRSLPLVEPQPQRHVLVCYDTLELNIDPTLSKNAGLGVVLLSLDALLISIRVWPTAAHFSAFRKNPAVLGAGAGVAAGSGRPFRIEARPGILGGHISVLVHWAHLREHRLHQPGCPRRLGLARLARATSARGARRHGPRKQSRHQPLCSAIIPSLLQYYISVAMFPVLFVHSYRRNVGFLVIKSLGSSNGGVRRT